MGISFGNHRLDKRFFQRNPPKDYSSAQILHFLLLNPDLPAKVEQSIDRMGMDMAAVRDACEQIRRECDIDVLLRWMRREVSGPCRQVICDRALEFEADVMPIVKRRVLTSFVDEFVESAVRMFVYAQENDSAWIMEHYQEIRNPYAQSMLCLVLGIRGDERCVSWLMDAYFALRQRFPDETFDQGPLLALYELDARLHLV